MVYMTSSLGTVSIYTMVVIGYDRYNVIVKGFSGVKINMAKAVGIVVSVATSTKICHATFHSHIYYCIPCIYYLSIYLYTLPLYIYPGGIRSHAPISSMADGECTIV
jgi:hypothetical protein